MLPSSLSHLVFLWCCYKTSQMYAETPDREDESCWLYNNRRPPLLGKRLDTFQISWWRRPHTSEMSTDRSVNQDHCLAELLNCVCSCVSCSLLSMKPHVWNSAANWHGTTGRKRAQKSMNKHFCVWKFTLRRKTTLIRAALMTKTPQIQWPKVETWSG